MQPAISNILVLPIGIAISAFICEAAQTPRHSSLRIGLMQHGACRELQQRQSMINR